MITVNIPEQDGIKTLTFSEADYRSLFGKWYSEILSLYTPSISDKEAEAILKYCYPDPKKVPEALMQFAGYGDVATPINYYTFRYDDKVFTGTPTPFSDILLDSNLGTNAGSSVSLLPCGDEVKQFSACNDYSIDAIKPSALNYLDTLRYYSQQSGEPDSHLAAVLRPYRDGDQINSDEIIIEQYGCKWRFDVRRAYIEMCRESELSRLD